MISKTKVNISIPRYLNVDFNLLPILEQSFYDFHGTMLRTGTELTAVFNSKHTSVLEQYLIDHDLNDCFTRGFKDGSDRLSKCVTERPVILVRLSFLNSPRLVLKYISEFHHRNNWKLITPVDVLSEKLRVTANAHLYINDCNRYFFKS